MEKEPKLRAVRVVADILSTPGQDGWTLPVSGKTGFCLPVLPLLLLTESLLSSAVQLLEIKQWLRHTQRGETDTPREERQQ